MKSIIKFEEARRRCAIAALVIHEDKAARYALVYGRLISWRELFDRSSSERSGASDDAPGIAGVLEDDLARAAALQRRVVTAKKLPDNGLLFRAEHFSPARTRNADIIALLSFCVQYL